MLDVGDNLPSYNDLRSTTANQYSVPAAPLRPAPHWPLPANSVESNSPPPPPPTQVNTDPVFTPTLSPVISPVEDPEDPNMLSLLPRLIETQASPTTLKKTRGRPRDVQPEQAPQQYPEPVRQNVVSAPLRLRKSPARGLSPSANESPRGRSVSAQPPMINTGVDQVHPHPPVPPQLGYVVAATADQSTRSDSTHSSEDAQSPNRLTTRAQRRRSWLPGVGGGSRLRSKSHEPTVGKHSAAWVLGTDSHADYNVDYLMNCEKVPELWDDNGTLYVYLSAHEKGQGASFKVRISVVEESRVLSKLVQSQSSSPASARSRARSFGGRDSLTAADAHRIHTPPMSPPLLGNESRLHLPSSNYNGLNGAPDIERLIALRNLFALLTGQPLVATRNFPTVYAALTQVAALLREFEFGYTTGGSNSFGDAVDLSTGFYIEHTGLSDLRFNREKTLEALVLGEQLRYWPLYNEAFCHAVGKYPALRELKISYLWDKLSPNTLQRLERAHLDLLTRQHSVNTRLEQFEFPSLFAGVANSTSNSDYRNIRFKNWRAAFTEMRAFVLKYYKTQFGSWPPKASSRRNPFSESGLNRLVLKTLYSDLCSVYDLLVNRNSITTRAGEDGTNTAMPSAASLQSPSGGPPADAAIMALRQILGEFDQSSPPVLPPVPFDTPKLPTMATIHETYPDMAPKDQVRFDKNVQPYELQLVLLKSHNVDAERPEESPFLAAFEAFELREARRGKSEAELSEMRIGHWLFLYVVLQSMPMLVVDAPGLHYTEGVEYFLCEPPQGRAPWVEDAGEVRKAWFQTAGGAGPLVELSADVLLYSVEATYHRSHCWLAAKKWSAEAARGSISVAGVAPNDVVIVQGAENVDAAAAAGVPFPMQAVPLIPDIPRDSSLGMSSSSPSLVTMATLVSAADSGATANASTTSSPRIHPTNYDDATGDNDTSPRSMSPTTQPQKSLNGQYSPQLQPTLQLQPALNLNLQPPASQPWVQPRDNYHQLQERAHLRHASIGWALEPVNLSDDGEPMPYSNRHSRTFPSTRRIASAGNLRAMVEASGNAGYNNPNGGGLGADLKAKPTFNAESTFDSILGNMDTNNSLAAPKKNKKRNSFLPFI
ncbi:hypothetical protein SEUCBS139899_009395 [Sporothrix eucalyptigena]